MKILSKINRRLAIATLFAVGASLTSGVVAAEKIKVAAIYTLPVEQQWISRIHKALNAAQDRGEIEYLYSCLLYTSPSPRDRTRSRMPSSA